MYPSLIYGIEVWANANETHLIPLVKNAEKGYIINYIIYRGFFCN